MNKFECREYVEQRMTRRIEMPTTDVRLVNCTPHEILVCASDGYKLRTIPPSGQIARAASERSVIGTLCFEGIEVPLAEIKLGGITGLPDPVPGTFYIVSAIAGTACKAAGRTDVLLTDDAVRDSENRVIGCRGFARP